MSLQALCTRLATMPLTASTSERQVDVTYKNKRKQKDDINDTVDTSKRRAIARYISEPDLWDELSSVVADLPIPAPELRRALAEGDVTAWRQGAIDRRHLRIFAIRLCEQRDRQVGRVPERYDGVGRCRLCGPVWLPDDGAVENCPWCANRVAGLPIPRPQLVNCATCRHFRRTAHQHLGKCQAGIKPAGAAGHWDTDRHCCSWWLGIE